MEEEKSRLGRAASGETRSCLPTIAFSVVFNRHFCQIKKTVSIRLNNLFHRMLVYTFPVTHQSIVTPVQTR